METGILTVFYSGLGRIVRRLVEKYINPIFTTGYYFFAFKMVGSGGGGFFPLKYFFSSDNAIWVK